MTADTIGGVWTYAVELARALGPAGVEFALATMGAPVSADQRRQVEQLQNVTVHESTWKLEWMDDPWHDVEESGRWLLELERAFNPDVIHLNGYAHAQLPFEAPTVVVAHSCVLSWWQAVNDERAPATWTRYRDEVQVGLESADMVVAPTGAMLRALTPHYGELPRTTVIPNGRDGTLYRRNVVKEPFILSAGRMWDEAKNIAALASIAGSLPWPVYVAGECGKSGKGANFLGRLDELTLARWYGRASIYALPARYEPFGLSAVEAALAGCALVLGDIPSLREVWGDAATFVAPDDTQALRRELIRLIENDDYRAARGRRAGEHTLQYTPRRMANAYVSVYRSLCSDRVTTSEECLA